MKTFRISFPRRVRIHGGECGAVARALHHAAQKEALMPYEQFSNSLISDECVLERPADLEKSSRSTFLERKQMSTKTSIKRIALVAVSALGFGLLSVVPAKAAYVTANVTSINLAQASVNTNITDSTVAVNIGAVIPSQTRVVGDQVLFQAALTEYPAGGFAAVSGKLGPNGESANTNATYPTGLAGTAVAGAGTGKLEILASATTAGSSVTATSTTGFGSFVFTPTKVGTYTLTVWHDTTASPDGILGATEVRQTISITVTAKPGFSAGTSSAYMIMGNGTTAGSATSDAIPASGPAAKANLNRGAVTVSLNNSLGSAMTSGNSINVDVSGPGYVSWVSADNAPVAATCAANPTYSASLGRSLRAQAADAVGTLYICSDGSVGTSTISISVTDENDVTTALSTKTFVFYGAVSKLEVSSALYTHGRAGGYQMGVGTGTRSTTGNLINPTTTTGISTTLPAFIVKATDSAGNPATADSAPTVVSSNASVVASGQCTLDTYVALASSGNGYGFYNCDFTTAAASKSGDKATLTIRIVDPADSTKFITTTLDITIGGSAYTHTLTLDKATYSTGEAMVVTRSAVDSSGNPAHDGATAPEVLFSKAIGGSAQTVAASWYTKGTVATSSTRPTVFAPASSGAFEARMSGAVAGVTSAIVAKATVGDDAATAAAAAAADAAAEAIDAANAATDAANLAAEAADAATVAAEEARDAADAATAAVEELASQVATLMAALKAQITTLANTVAKIAKKVKA